jgi:hypothetical protein
VYPNAGFNCKKTNYSNTHLPTPVRNLTPSLSLNQLYGEPVGKVVQERPAGPPLSTLEWCPDTGDQYRKVLLNGYTIAIPFPNASYNCKNTEYEGFLPPY